MTSSGVVSQQWPDAEALMAAVRGALRGDSQAAHPVLNVVCDLALLYRDHGDATARCGAPPAMLGCGQAGDNLTEAATAELRLAYRFDQVAAQAFELGQSRPGLLAARLVYWTVHAKVDTVHHSIAATHAYSQWLARLSACERTGRTIDTAYT